DISALSSKVLQLCILLHGFFPGCALNEKILKRLSGFLDGDIELANVRKVALVQLLYFLDLIVAETELLHQTCSLRLASRREFVAIHELPGPLALLFDRRRHTRR